MAVELTKHDADACNSSRKYFVCAVDYMDDAAVILHEDGERKAGTAATLPPVPAARNAARGALAVRAGPRCLPLAAGASKFTAESTCGCRHRGAAR